MQKHKQKFRDVSYTDTFANIQSCLRLNDLDEIQDGNHLLYFNMIGFFSFRQWTLKQTIDFFLEFMESLGIRPDYVTIHPDKEEWKEYYPNHKVVYDEECIWSDGDIGGYCTEFYYKGLEIGNIVNTLGTCIDVGFGLERLQMVLDPNYVSTEDTVLVETVKKLIESGITTSNNKQGYILKKLIRKLIKKGIILEKYPIFMTEVEKVKKQLEKFNRLYPKNMDKSKEWWWDTHGIQLE